MLPIANELYLGRIKALDKKRGEEVEIQFRKFTNNGFLGSLGESPDRAEAFAWACFELLGISEYGTQGTVFKEEMLCSERKGLLSRVNLGVLWVQGGEFGLIVGNIYKAGKNSFFEGKEAIKGDVQNFSALTRELEINELFCNDVIFGRGLKMQGLKRKAHFDLNNVEEFAISVAPSIYGKINLENVNESLYLGVSKNWLKYDLLKFRGEDKESLTPLVCGFCGILKLL